jgi:hypothetical protein
MLSIAVVVGLILGAVLGYIYGVVIATKGMEHKAISAGHGHYNKGTGRFKFGMDPATVTLKRRSLAQVQEDLESSFTRERESQEKYINQLYDDLESKDDEIKALKKKLKKKGK